MSSQFYLFNNATLRALGFTQMQICMASGISLSTLAGILYRGTVPSLPTARKIAKALNVPLDTLHFVFEQQQTQPTIKPQPTVYQANV